MQFQSLALLVTILAVLKIEPRGLGTMVQAPSEIGRPSFREAFLEVWAEPRARRFAIFVFISMLAYSAQDLILEPFAGNVFGYSPGQTTQLSSVQHTGVLAGMVLVAVLGSAVGGALLSSMRMWTIAGCIASAVALLGLAAGGLVGPPWPLRETVFGLGVANGAYAVAAIGSMMGLAGTAHPHREGIRMGLWGAAQAIAFGLGGFAGTLASDVARSLLGTPGPAYALVFAGEAALFLAAVGLVVRVGRPHGAGGDVSTSFEEFSDARRSCGRFPCLSLKPTMSSLSAAVRLARPPRIISRNADTTCCCSIAQESVAQA